MANGKGRRRKNLKKRAFNLGNKLFPIAKAVAAPIAFVEQISAKDRQTMGSAFDNAPTTQKLKILSNIITGRITGINFFQDEFQAQQTLNPAGVLNKWTQNGAIMLVYGVIGKQVNKMAGQEVVPVTAKIKSIGKQLIIGGGVGGFFDEPVGTSSSPSSAPSAPVGTRALSTRRVLAAPSAFSRGRGFARASRGDSTESGL